MSHWSLFSVLILQNRSHFFVLFLILSSLFGFRKILLSVFVYANFCHWFYEKSINSLLLLQIDKITAR